MKRKLAAMFMALSLAAGLLAGCGSKEGGSGDQGDKGDKMYKIGVIQLTEHPALDAAYEGFVEGLKEAGYEEGLPAFYQVEFNVDEPADTFLDMTGWGKGFVVVNAFNLGRFWEEGPQRRLYLPGALLKPGKNELLIFETEGKHKDTVILCDTPDLGDE